MFSSNQILQISGDFDQLEAALKFALEYSGYIKDIREDEYQRGCRLTYQVTKDGKYCIGWYFLEDSYDELPRGWLEYPFRFDIGIVSKIIIQHLDQFPIKRIDLDGGFDKGFIMKVIPENMGSEYSNIQEPFYGIVSFDPYTCFYSK